MLPPGLPRKEVIAFSVISFVIFIFLLLRAVTVPLVHDEAATFLHYIIPGEFLPGVAHWDAANHVLNTALAIGSVWLFGESEWAMRLPSVLSFIVFAIASQWVASECKSKMVRQCMLIALLACPFLLDFFALCRGYGPGMAFFMVSLAACFQLIHRPRERVLSALLTSSVLAIWADMALLPMMGLLLAITGVLSWRKLSRSLLYDPIVLLTMLIVAIGWLAAIAFAGELSARGLLYHGSTDGFLEVTVRPLLRSATGLDGPFVLSIATIIFLLVIGAAWLRGERNTSLLLTSLLMLSSILGTVILAEVFHVNYPEDRAALQFLVLTLILVGVAIDRWQVTDKWVRWGAVVLLLLPVRSLIMANVDRTMLWSEQSLPSELFDAIEQHQAASTDPITVGVYHQHALVYAFAARSRDDRLPQSVPFGQPDTLTDLILVDARFTQVLGPAYRQTDGPYHDGLTLFRRDPPLTRVIILHEDINDQETRSEFIDLPRPQIGTLHGKALQVRFQADVMLHPTSVLHFVVSTSNGDVQDQYHAHDIRLAKDREGVRRIDISHVLQPIRANIDRVAIYLWNPNKKDIDISNTTLTYYALGDP